MEIYNYISLIIAVIAMVVSILAFIYTVKTYLLKTGDRIRGGFSVCSSIACEDVYISNIAVENYKDKSVVIYKIYLQIGYNYFIELEEFEDNPLVLKPFEAYTQKYDPIEFYSINTYKIQMNKLLRDKRTKKRLVLSTSNGKYTIRKQLKHWNLIGESFKNHSTAVIVPIRGEYNGKAYGYNTRYIIEVKLKKGDSIVVPVYKQDTSVQGFKNFIIPQEALKSREELEEFLYLQAVNGKLQCEDIVVYEMEKWRQELFSRQLEDSIEAEYYSWIRYKIMGKISTIHSNYKLKLKNRKNRKAKNSN